MIVSDDTIQAAFDYRMQRPHPIGITRLDLENAKSRAKEAYSRAYLSADGTVEERKCIAEVDREHVAAKDILAKAQADYEAERERVDRCEWLKSIWQSERTNQRELGKFG